MRPGTLLSSLAWVTLLALPQRSLAVYFACMALAWTGFGLACRGSVTPRLLWSLAVLWRLLGLFAEPVFENDWARFFWDGWLTSHGHDPFLSVPMDWFTDNTVPSEMARVLDHINHPQLHTVYGPVAQLVFALACGSLVRLKLILMACDLVVIALLQKNFGAKRAMLYAWCPLIIQETAFSAHPDVIAIVLMIMAWHWRRRLFIAGLLMGVALAARPQAVLMLPFLLWRTQWRGPLGVIIALIACYGPIYLWHGHWAEIQTLSQMSGDWHFNDIVRSGLAWLTNEGVARAASLLILITGCGLIFLRWCKHCDALPLALVYALWWLCSPVANAWYLQFAVPFLVMRSSRMAWALIITAPLTYATGLQLAGATEAWELAPWVMPVEAVVCLLAVLAVRQPAETMCQPMLNE
jgi:uncharacterized membrane protein